MDVGFRWRLKTLAGAGGTVQFCWMGEGGSSARIVCSVLAWQQNTGGATVMLADDPYLVFFAKGVAR